MKTINQNNDCGNARDYDFNTSACNDAGYICVSRPKDCRPADTVDSADAKNAAEENARNGTYCEDCAGLAGDTDCVGVADDSDGVCLAGDADCAGVAGNDDAKEDGCSAAEKKSSVDGGTDSDGECKALEGLRDKLFDELDLMFAARSDNARKLVMPIAELEEISDMNALFERFYSCQHSSRCSKLLSSLTKAFFDEAVAVMIIDEASSADVRNSTKQ